MMDTERIAAALAEAGDNKTVTVDGMRYRYWFDPDPGTTINDFDCYGKTEIVRASDGVSRRPSSFDGSARIINRDRGWHTWWQPPTDIHADEIDNTLRLVCDIVEHGFRLVIVERLAGDDAYGCPIVTDYQSYGGIEPFPSDEDIRYHIESVLDFMAGGV